MTGSGGPRFRHIVGQHPLRLDRLRRPEQPHGAGRFATISRGLSGCHSGARRRREPGIHFPEAGVHGFRASPCGRSRNDIGSAASFFFDPDVDRGAFGDVALARLDMADRVETQPVAEPVEQRSDAPTDFSGSPHSRLPPPVRRLRAGLPPPQAGEGWGGGLRAGLPPPQAGEGWGWGLAGEGWGGGSAPVAKARRRRRRGSCPRRRGRGRPCRAWPRTTSRDGAGRGSAGRCRGGCARRGRRRGENESETARAHSLARQPRREILESRSIARARSAGSAIGSAKLNRTRRLGVSPSGDNGSGRSPKAWSSRYATASPKRRASASRGIG